LDRHDSDEQPGHYEPGNVRWATLPEQRRNRRPKPAVVEAIFMGR
jgi:hypothetical protein